MNAQEREHFLERLFGLMPRNFRLTATDSQVDHWAKDAGIILDQVAASSLPQATPQEPKKPGHFTICAEMSKRDLDIRLSPLENVTNVQYQKRTKGTLITIGIDGNLVADIGLDNKFVGGLLLCDRKQYFEIADELAAPKGD